MAALNLSRGKQLIISHVAARLNGYVGGYGNKVFISVKYYLCEIFLRNGLSLKRMSWVSLMKCLSMF